MALLDQFGHPWGTPNFARAIKRNRHRGLRGPGQNKGINELIGDTDRRTLAALSRKIVWNIGIPKECCRQKATMSVGAAWLPQYHGDDRKRGEMAAEWLQNEWYLSPDVRGGSDWWDLLELVSKSMDRDGEAFVLMTSREDGWPALQHIPAHTIRQQGEGLKPNAANTRQFLVEGGPFDGALIEDGVIHDEFLTPLGYRYYYSEEPEKYMDIPAGSMIHVYDRDFPEQLRGYPAFSHALSDLEQSLQSTELELLRQMLVSSIFLVEKGDEVDLNDPTYENVLNTTTGEGTIVEQVAPGIRHISSETSLDTITHNNPGDAWEVFQDRINRNAVIGMGWSAALVGKAAGQGTAERSEVVRARQAIKTRQRGLTKFARRAVSYVTAAAHQVGITGSVPNSMQWGFTMPARLTVDDGREDASLLESVQAGASTLSQYLANQGRSRREHFLEAAMELVEAQKVAEEVSQRTGVMVDVADILPTAPRDPAAEEEPETEEEQ